MPGQMEYHETVKVSARATFTFPTDEANRIIGRSLFRGGDADVVLESVEMGRGAASDDERGLFFRDALQDNPWRTMPRATVKGRLILKSGALGKDLVDMVFEVGFGSRVPEDDPRVERIADIVRACWTEFEQKTGTAKDVLSRADQ